MIARVISLDLDDTLWPVAPVIASAEVVLFDWLKTHYPRAARGHTIESMRTRRARIAVRYPERSHDLTFLRRHSLARQFVAAGYAESLCDEAMEVFLEARNRVELYDDVRPSLTRLRAAYRLYAVSNGNADLQRCGIGDLFDGHVTAISAGAAKPDARIFAALAEMARREPRRGAARRRRSAGGRGGSEASGNAGGVAQSRFAHLAGHARAACAHHFDARRDSVAPH